MPTSLPVPTKNPGDVLTSSLWNSYLRDNVNKLLNQGHRVLTVAQFTALTGLEDGDEVYLEVDATNGIMWHLRYVAAEPTHKWRFLGGPFLLSEVQTSESTVAGAYTDLTTVGPSVIAPRAGTYEIAGGVGSHSSATGVLTSVAAKLGAAATANTELMAQGVGGGGGGSGHGARPFISRTLAASDTVKLQYLSSNGTFANRTLGMRPVRVI